MNIREFIDATKEKHREHLRNHRAVGVLLTPGKHIYWNEELANAGYITVKLTRSADWPEVHRWCIDNFGEDHYTWSGTDFWFESEEDAIMFSLRW